jgi:hypothetical protein
MSVYGNILISFAELAAVLEKPNKSYIKLASRIQVSVIGSSGNSKKVFIIFFY